MCDVYDPAEPIADEWRKARKEHRCFACREIIRKGDRYHLIAQKDDGEFGVFKHCARCWEMGNALLRAGSDTWAYDLNCGASWEDTFGSNPPDEVAALAFLTPDEAQERVGYGKGRR
jgi:hypothetical protein